MRRKAPSPRVGELRPSQFQHTFGIGAVIDLPHVSAMVMGLEDWQTGYAKALGVFLNGDALPDADPRGHRVTDDGFLLLFNAHHDDLPFVLPGGRWARRWQPEFDTAGGSGESGDQPAGAGVVVAARSVRTLRRG